MDDLNPCPFCGASLVIRHKVNPLAECLTDGCWLNARQLAIAVDEPAHVAAWNRRAAEAQESSATPGALAALQGMVDAYWRGSVDSDDDHAPPAVKAALAVLAQARPTTDLATTIAKIAERWIYRTPHNGPKHLCKGIAADVVAALANPAAHIPAEARAVYPVWQPIETAPKDGTRVLIWFVHENAKFSKDPIGEGWAAAHEAQWIDHNGGGWTWHGLCGVATLWQPLPSPPKAEGAQ